MRVRPGIQVGDRNNANTTAKKVVTGMREAQRSLNMVSDDRSGSPAGNFSLNRRHPVENMGMADGTARLASPPLNSHEEGQAMVEFAIVMPMVLFITMGIAELAVIYTARAALDGAAHAAARAELVGEDPLNAATLVLSAVSGPTVLDGPNEPIIIPGWGELPRSRAAHSRTRIHVITPLSPDGDRVSVEVGHDHELLFPEISVPFFSGTVFKGFSANGASFLTLKDTAVLPKPWKGL